MRIACASCKNCSTSLGSSFAACPRTGKSFLSVTLSQMLWDLHWSTRSAPPRRDYTVVFSQPIFSWPLKPARITTRVSSVVDRLLLDILQTIHIICARDIISCAQPSIVYVALAMCSLRFLMPTCSGHALSSSARACTKHRTFLGLRL